jgi:hypothetical protein
VGDKAMLTEIAVTLIPVLPSLLAGALFQRDHEPVRRMRSTLFCAGLFGSLIAALLIIGSWMQPFPLSSFQGGYSNGRNLWLSLTAFIAAVLVVALSLFGRGQARLLLLLSGLLSTILSIAAFMSNNR